MTSKWEATKEWRRNWDRQNYAKHREKFAARRVANREKLREYKRRWYAAHRAEQAATRHINRERIRVTRAAWRAAHKDEINDYQRAWRLKRKQAAPKVQP